MMQSRAPTAAGGDDDQESMSLLTKAWYLTKHLGVGWLGFRLRYAVRRRTGALRRRSPCVGWEELPCPDEDKIGCFQRRPGEIGVGCEPEAVAVLLGRFRVFSGPEVAAGFPPEWTRNQLTGEKAPASAHWSTLGDFAFGDIKGVWELSRFPWAFPLARAYARTGDERFAEGFWALFEDWLQHNPPNAGPNWMCGQEATFRLMAATFARSVLAESPTSTLGRIESFRRFVLATGRRIEANLEYSLSQSNNHGISESTGLLLAASLLPTVPESARWWDQGQRALGAQVQELVYRDGGFSQHSAVYHRVLLCDLLVARLALQAWGQEPPAWFLDAGRRASEFLGTLISPETGTVPLYGANDGANVLPLTDADFLDFRPVWQAAAAVFCRRRPLPPGPWDELAEWVGSINTLDVLSPAASPVERAHHTEAGCMIWRSGELRLFLRCPTSFRHRPSQCDLLHVDLAWRGERIAHDAGTYSYNTPGAFRGAFKKAAVHNTVTFEGCEPMRKAGRFLFLPWPRGEVGWIDEATFFATHDGWREHGMRHERIVTVPVSERFVVRDKLEARVGARRARVHWLLADVPHEFQAEHRQLLLRTPVGGFLVTWSEGEAKLLRADSSSDRGWWSPRYHQAEPALCLTLEVAVSPRACIETIFAPA
jgi:Heparinase II/III-like protein/Heparinase II/III N-terminus